MSGELAAERPRIDRIAVAARALGNVLIGIALGLASYYVVTDIEKRISQAQLRDELAAFVPPVLDRPVLGPPSPIGPIAAVMDFTGWQIEDLRYWRTLEVGGVFGRIVAEGMGVDSLVVKGATTETLRRGPGWITYTDLPGPTGMAAISAHRTTYGAPFRRIDELAEGDIIDVFSPFRRYRYVVQQTLIVTPDQVEVVASTEEPMLSLTACHPPFSARYRIIVQAALIDVRRMTTEQLVGD